MIPQHYLQQESNTHINNVFTNAFHAGNLALLIQFQLHKQFSSICTPFY